MIKKSKLTKYITLTLLLYLSTISISLAMNIQKELQDVYITCRLLGTKNLQYQGYKAISFCGNHIVSGSKNGHIVLFNIQNNTQRYLYQHSGGYLTCIAISPSFTSPRYVASASTDNQVIVYDIANRRKKCFYHHTFVSEMYFDFLQPQKFLISSSTEGEHVLYNIKKNKRERTSNIPTRGVSCDNFSVCRSYCAIGFENKKAIVWDIRNKKEICSYHHDAKICCISLSKCNNYVASGAYSGQVVLYDIKNKKQIHSYNHNTQICYIIFNQNTKKFISVDWNGLVQVWQLFPENPLVKQDLKERVQFIKRKKNKIKKTTIKLNNNNKISCFASLFVTEQNRNKMEKITQKLHKKRNELNNAYKTYDKYQYMSISRLSLLYRTIYGDLEKKIDKATEKILKIKKQLNKENKKYSLYSS